MSKKYLFGCDWGTSSFRLRLINTNDHEVVEEVLSEEGIANTYNLWKKDGEHRNVDKLQFFKAKIANAITMLSNKLDMNLANVPIIISGMASSSLGMDDVPYATLPFPVDGSAARYRFFPSEESFPNSVTLVSGVRAEKDVMRGEETQLVGLLSLLDKSIAAENAILIFPGTHSKHLYVAQNQLIDLQTFMTGEIFSLMVNASVLKNSVNRMHLSAFSDDNVAAFKAGVQGSVSSNILSSLFSVRTNELFGTLNKEQNFFYLSGLLIGAELKGLHEKASWQLILCSGSNLFEHYKVALEALNLTERTTTIPPALIDRAAVAGQIKIFESVKAHNYE
jgi:2-dehydro-3-deoxygalactonokinase